METAFHSERRPKKANGYLYIRIVLLVVVSPAVRAINFLKA